ncbi:arsenite efflux transporter metallochaperone ArsD [Clostridium algidicarnis]|uniref:Arsenite efflux transporter metallochaperone ArsD n=1 Tax=Clostridium algidicarnis TaxID=37659 RepID=A0ABS6C1W1_9CLOT|nr:arsenite efflux transporter metallochaperone ArsD [Clostridium algidicarnis]MBU3219458.1 arsenite efflux transporter metallochaperone ArsD [Clostridium algidicarnis]
MSKIEIFDPAMCCSTGVCGPSIDKNLLRVATIVNKLGKKGIDIKRYNLSSEAKAFIDNKKVNEYLMDKGADILPITLVDGEIVKVKEYPTNDEFFKWSGESKESLNRVKIQKPDKSLNTNKAINKKCCDSNGNGCC